MPFLKLCKIGRHFSFLQTTAPVLLYCSLWCHFLNGKEGAYHSWKYTDHLRIKLSTLNYILGRFSNFKCHFTSCTTSFISAISILVCLYSLKDIVAKFHNQRSQKFVVTTIVSWVHDPLKKGLVQTKVKLSVTCLLCNITTLNIINIAHQILRGTGSCRVCIGHVWFTLWSQVAAKLQGVLSEGKNNWNGR